MNRLPSPDAVPAAERRVTEFEIGIAGMDRVFRTPPALFKREHDGPLRLLPPENPARQFLPEAASGNVVPITSTRNYRSPEVEVVSTDMHQMAEAARATIRQLGALETPESTLGDGINQSGQRAA